MNQHWYGCSRKKLPTCTGDHRISDPINSFKKNGGKPFLEFAAELDADGKKFTKAYILPNGGKAMDGGDFHPHGDPFLPKKNRQTKTTKDFNGFYGGLMVVNPFW